MINIAFFGTHDFAVEILQGLIDDPNINIEVVITQADKPVGRKKIITPPPIKILAQKYNLKIKQPESLKDFILEISNLDLNIVCQYGKIIPPHILNYPEYKTLNVHTSLLPKYRGASPIQSAILNGEDKTGITIMLMDDELDHGPILAQIEVRIDKDDNYSTLSIKMAKKGKILLLNTIPAWINGEIKPQTQDENQKTLCYQITKEDGQINWNNFAKQIYNQYRAYYVWPGIWTIWQNKRIKFLNIVLSDIILSPGQIKVEDKKIFIGTKNESIEVTKLQIEGKKPMTAPEFLNGYPDFKNSILK